MENDNFGDFEILGAAIAAKNLEKATFSLKYIFQEFLQLKIIWVPTFFMTDFCTEIWYLSNYAKKKFSHRNAEKPTKKN